MTDVVPAATGTARVVVVGGSLAGLRVAEQLRAAGHAGPLIVVGEERHLPYNRPPLSKDVLHDAGEDLGDQLLDRLHGQLAFRRRRSVADVDFRLGRRAVASDLAAGTVTLDDGTVLDHAALVAATGLRSRRLDVPGPVEGRHAIRTLDDAVALRAAIGRRPQVVVVGAGFVGCETAASLRRLGLDVTVVEPYGVPLGLALGAELGTAVQHHLEAAGVRFELGSAVVEFAGAETVAGVVLQDGRTLPAGLVVESIGSVCNVEWLGGNRLDLSDGVLCGNDLRAAENLWAVGDVARFPNPLFDATPRRVEHWSMPTDTAKRAAASIVAALAGASVEGPDFMPIPSFWSDLLDLRLQSFGSPALGDEARIEEGDPARLAAGLLVTYHRDGRHVGSVAVNLTPARQRGLREAFLPLVPIA